MLPEELKTSRCVKNRLNPLGLLGVISLETCGECSQVELQTSVNVSFCWLTEVNANAGRGSGSQGVLVCRALRSACSLPSSPEFLVPYTVVPSRGQGLSWAEWTSVVVTPALSVHLCLSASLSVKSQST